MVWSRWGPREPDRTVLELPAVFLGGFDFICCVLWKLFKGGKEDLEEGI
jgi:hypothetical protein